MRSKFGYQDLTDFETRLYLCLAVFQPLHWGYYVGMSESGAMVLYLAVVAFEVASIAFSVFRRWDRAASAPAKEKIEDSGGNDDVASAAVAEGSNGRSGLRHRGGAKKQPQPETPAASETPEEASSFDVLDGTALEFFSRADLQPGRCYHIGKSFMSGFTRRDSQEVRH